MEPAGVDERAAADDERDRRLAAEACRLHERYTIEVVERFNFCPWARKGRADGVVARRALLQRNMDPAPTLALLSELEGGPATPPMMIAIYPRMSCTAREFDAFAAAIKAADQARHGGRPEYVSATFHPGYPYDDRSPGTLVPWLRRSPDPSLQLVRLEMIEEARGPSGEMLFDFSPEAWAELRRRMDRGTVPERIARDNRDTVAREHAAIEQAIADIAADRARSYAGLR